MSKPLTILVAQIWSLDLSREIALGIAQYARHKSHRWKLITLSSDLFSEKGAFWQSDGVVVNPHAESLFDIVAKLNKPAVVMQRNPHYPNVLQVDINHFSTGKMAAQHLVRECGCKNVAFIQNVKSVGVQLRKEGFLFQCNQYGVNAKTFFLSNGKKALSDHLLKWLEHSVKPLALYCSSDLLAAGLLDQIEARGYLIPKDIFLLGSENDELICEGCYPTLSSIQSPYRQAGFEAARLLDRALKGESIKRKVKLLEPIGIKTRMTTHGYGGRNVSVQQAVEFICKHAFSDIKTHDIAHYTGLSQRSLERIMRSETGCSPYEYIQFQRMKRVKYLLRESSLTLDEIAAQTGYCNGHSLGQVFKRIFKQSATSYRNSFSLNQYPADEMQDIPSPS